MRLMSDDDLSLEPDMAALMADLQHLVDAGLLIEVRHPGQPSRYALREQADEPVLDAAD